MAQEIERKFLVKGGFKEAAFDALRITQGYLSTAPGRSVRVRLKGDKGFLTIKGPSRDGGLSRFEWEKEIGADEARELLALCEPGIIDKTRWLVKAGTHTFEVDEFHGDNEGLIVAEVELNAPDESYEKPEWLGQEVTGDRRYYNSYLTKNPYKIWK
jgi:adenylate cyclase